jgi:flagellar hook-associated protein 2
VSTVSSTTPESPGTALSTVVAPEQISGLASGLDTASIISALMQVDSQPMIAIQNQLKLEQARQAAYQSVSTELSSLTTAYQSLTDVTAWAPTQSVTSSDASTVSATINGGAAAGAYEINVTQLARANQFTEERRAPQQTT